MLLEGGTSTTTATISRGIEVNSRQLVHLLAREADSPVFHADNFHVYDIADVYDFLDVRYTPILQLADVAQTLRRLAACAVWWLAGIPFERNECAIRDDVRDTSFPHVTHLRCTPRYG